MAARRVWGPYDRGGGKWEVSYDDRDGRRRAKQYRSAAGAARAVQNIQKAILREQQEHREEIAEQVPPWDGTVGWFQRVLAIKTREVAMGSGPDARNDLRAIAQACVAAKNLSDTAELEAKVAHLEAARADVLRRIKHSVAQREDVLVLAARSAGQDT